MLQPSTGTLVVLCTRVLLCGVVVCKRGGEVSLQLYCVSCEEVLRGWGWLAGLPLPLPLYCRYPWMDARGGGGEL
jgi:hypothetical protein